jgi:hypothetical protein
LGVFLAIKVSYATIPNRNVIESTASATRDLPVIDHQRPKDIKIVYIFQSFPHGRKPTLFSLTGEATRRRTTWARHRPLSQSRAEFCAT